MGQKVTFESVINHPQCLEAPSRLWDFGDGGISSDANPAHGYSVPGCYTWTLTVTADGVTCMSAGAVEVSETVSPTIPGDCDGSGDVSIGEVQKAINMFLGTLAPGCGVDCNGNGTVSIGEIQKVINGFLGLPSSC